MLNEKLGAGGVTPQAGAARHAGGYACLWRLRGQLEDILGPEEDDQSATNQSEESPGTSTRHQQDFDFNFGAPATPRRAKAANPGEAEVRLAEGVGPMRRGRDLSGGVGHTYIWLCR